MGFYGKQVFIQNLYLQYYNDAAEQEDLSINTLSLGPDFKYENNELRYDIQPVLSVLLDNFTEIFTQQGSDGEISYIIPSSSDKELNTLLIGVYAPTSDSKFKIDSTEYSVPAQGFNLCKIELTQAESQIDFKLSSDDNVTFLEVYGYKEKKVSYSLDGHTLILNNIGKEE